MNALSVTGNLVADPKEVAYGDSGQKLADFRIANNELVNGESVSNGFFDVTVFGALAQHVLKSCRKGTPVVVSGRLDHRTFEREDGTRGGRTRIMASAVGLSLQFNDGVLTPRAQS